ncbi:MAG: hypothetical protein V4850_20865 [Myxococcota bacterium]
MSFLALVALVSGAWLLWVVACVRGLSADIAEGKRPHDARFSLMPVIPVFPLMAIGLAMGIDGLSAPWGTRLIGGSHALLVILYIGSIIRDVCRLQRVRREPRN